MAIGRIVAVLKIEKRNMDKYYNAFKRVKYANEQASSQSRGYYLQLNLCQRKIMKGAVW